MTYPFSNTRKAASFPTLVYSLSDPVDSGVSANLVDISQRTMQKDCNAYRLMVRVYEYNLIVLVHAILVDPV
jgi:hypothetical protein